MGTTKAPSRATAAWIARIDSRPIRAYLRADIVAKLDALVLARGASGRAAVLAEPGLGRPRGPECPRKAGASGPRGKSAPAGLKRWD